MPVKIQKVMDIIENFAPRHLAESWDNVGLQIGDPEDEIKSILVSLDIDEAVLREASSKEIDLIVTHHPLIFQPVKTLRFDTPVGKLVTKLITNRIALYVAHTNLDSTIGGINDILAELLHLQKTEVLAPSMEEKLFKIVVFVPKDFLELVRDAICEAGAGWIGNYSHCTFSVAGKGTFKPLEGSNPFIGTHGDLENVEEYRLETVVTQRMLNSVVGAMIKNHPYEEVAYDVYPMELEGKKYGLGRVGELDHPVRLDDLAKEVKKVLGIEMVKVVGNRNQLVSKVAVCGGAGASFIDKAKSQGAQCLITGDLKYHEGQHARELGLTAIDAGHYATENLIIPGLARHLRDEFFAQNMSVVVYESKENTNPWVYL